MTPARRPPPQPGVRPAAGGREPGRNRRLSRPSLGGGGRLGRRSAARVASAPSPSTSDGEARVEVGRSGAALAAGRACGHRRSHARVRGARGGAADRGLVRPAGGDEWYAKRFAWIPARERGTQTAARATVPSGRFQRARAVGRRTRKRCGAARSAGVRAGSPRASRPSRRRRASGAAGRSRPPTRSSGRSRPIRIPTAWSRAPALAQLVEDLLAAGWEREGRGRHWYAQRFSWRREGDPPVAPRPSVRGRGRDRTLHSGRTAARRGRRGRRGGRRDARRAPAGRTASVAAPSAANDERLLNFFLLLERVHAASRTAASACATPTSARWRG